MSKSIKFTSDQFEVTNYMRSLIYHQLSRILNLKPESLKAGVLPKYAFIGNYEPSMQSKYEFNNGVIVTKYETVLRLDTNTNRKLAEHYMNRIAALILQCRPAEMIDDITSYNVSIIKAMTETPIILFRNSGMPDKYFSLNFFVKLFVSEKYKGGVISGRHCDNIDLSMNFAQITNSESLRVLSSACNL